MDKELLRDYNAFRTGANKTLLCHAPFTNINFAQNGNMTACCFNRSHILGKIPFQSIEEAWYGKQADELRNYIRHNNLGGGCKLCELALTSRNFSGSKAIYYDGYADSTLIEAPKNLFDKLFGRTHPAISPPKVFEFELDNTCNLECIMCDGYFSSTVRKQREQLPPVKNPYTDDFVEQVAKFLPRLTDLKFLGGEPFLIDIYLKIWEKVLQVNPDIRIHITTNGTIMNSRVKTLLDKLNCGIVVSLDSINPETYSQIRKGGNLERVMENLEYFRQLTKSKGTYLSLAVCPMRTNWHEMPELVNFANKHDISIHFNIVWNPEEVSLRFESPSVLAHIADEYSKFNPDIKNNQQRNNFENFKSLKNQVQFWLEERKKTWQMKQHYGRLFREMLDTTDETNLVEKNYTSLLLMQLNGSDELKQKAKTELLDLSKTTSAEAFIPTYFKGIEAILEKTELANRKQKQRLEKIQSTALGLTDKQTFVSDIIRNGLEAQLGYFMYEDLDLLIDTLKARYSMTTAV